jgi:predicted ester cyclase
VLQNEVMHHDSVVGINDLREHYRRYLAACNARDWRQVGHLVAPDVEANDQPRGREGYIADIRTLIDAFPDFQWSVRHLVIEGDIVSAHLAGRGTQQTPFLGVSPSESPVVAPEFAVYRFHDGRIVQLWSTVNHLLLLPDLAAER